jgi:hypothetical protein
MTQMDKAASANPETNTSYPGPHAQVNQDADWDSSSDHGDSDDDDLDQLEDLLKSLRIRMTSTKNERKAFRERNQALEDEIVELRARNAELDQLSRYLRAQLDQAEVQLRTSETEHNSVMERLSQQVAEREQRVGAVENDLENTRLDLANTKRSNLRTRILWPVSDAVKFQSLQSTFGHHIAEALSSLPANPEYCQRYRMTSSTPARGPDRRAHFHPEFRPADGPGLFVMFRGKVTWLQIWLQEQY